EKNGTFTNSERRCSRINKAIEPVGNALADWRIISRLATAMDYPMNYAHAEEIFEEMRALTPKSYAGMTYERLGIDGLQWPCPDTDHPGTPYLHSEQFARGKGQFHAIEYQDPAEMPDADYPYFLTTGRVFAHYHTGTMTRLSKHLDQEAPFGYVDINPLDARNIKVGEGDPVILSSRRGEMEVAVRLNEKLSPGSLFLPIHFGESAANLLTSSEALDPLAKIPEFKVSAVHVARAS
ncbi:MAG TPA: molybdopterin dinucleotide binding domain-containing protein, partial [Desulfosalsimonadaceae bacterium]|nr:molybdopterin dinucleotide binding domain-containing protein [Desulfosalsimonadaceae bacterium]